MDLTSRFGFGEFREASDLPDHQRKLHRAVMRAAHMERPPRPEDRDDNGREWAGLVENHDDGSPSWD